MSDQTILHSSIQDVDLSRVEQAGRASPTWRRVFQREFHELWIGGKATVLLLLFSVVLGFQAYVTGTNVELSLMPPKEMVYELLKTAIAVGLFIGLIIVADSISGERERSTLESLLLTPTSRRQVVFGKFLAALSPWPAALLLTMQTLRDQAAKLTKHLEEAKNATESTWGDVKAGSKNGYRELKDGFQQARLWVSDKIAP